ncbi:EAL domain-containing protein [Solirubrobacter phytolaccae]|uniref:EAL domain-containing protein n=1 Tax=Solirubrobacter phytolaccae TaxID=1404360 RepID=A0A9X3SAZ1_9ACTN|nr:GGDEF domain-containing phosphodiesterase [Solirubrobacter phytolaccae]MDA0183036.1 EAL domain-containing protein [Solirubrobacter phytolaccae]
MKRPSLLLAVVIATTLAALAVLGHLLLNVGSTTDELAATRIVASQTANGQRDLLLFQRAVNGLALDGTVEEAELRRGLALQQLKNLERHAPDPASMTRLEQRVRAVDLTGPVAEADAQIAAVERDFKAFSDSSNLAFRATVADAVDARGGTQRLLAVLIGLTLVLAVAATLQARAKSSRRFRALVQHASDVTLLIDERGVIQYASPSLERVIGVTPEDAEGAELCGLIPEDEAGRLTRQLAPLADTGGQLPVEFSVLHTDGTKRLLDGTVVNLLDESAVGAIVFNVRDVTDRRELEGELTELAFHDALTGLANRALLRERIGHAAARSRRNETAGAAVMLIDLDDFKSVNDGLGHREGDLLLQAVARRLEGAIRSADTAARLGGDEFVIFAEDVDSIDEAAELAERVLAAFDAPFELSVGAFHCRASVGVRYVVGAQLDADDLLRDADLAMYSAKGAGKGTWTLFESGMGEEASERLTLRAELHRALENDELVLHFQPIVDLKTEAVTGFEALVRWQHPTRGLLAPDMFIGLAESTGIIHRLGAWVIREATGALRRFQDASGDHELAMNVNVSPLQLENAWIVDVVRSALEVAAVGPRCLSLEVTEGVFLSDTAMVAERLQALNALGVRIALDDFGTGFSALGYLERLPLEGLKIDRAFVSGVAADNRGQVLGAIAGLANGLGLSTVAEGIETEAQLAAVRALGCDRGQGYLFSRPLPEAAAAAHLATSRSSGRPSASASR